VWGGLAVALRLMLNSENDDGKLYDEHHEASEGSAS